MLIMIMFSHINELHVENITTQKLTRDFCFPRLHNVKKKPCSKLIDIF